MSGSASSLRWTLSGFLAHLRFVHTNMRDHAYAWVLGAGASRSSGIPLAGELAQRWLSELHRRLDTTGQPLPEWATAENLGIAKFDYQAAASFYSRLYERRFGDNPDEGFAYLEALMSGKDPSPGYSILAQVLEKTSHKVVISTNFDNLVADALSIYTETFPLVIGHESLANFVRVVSRRPVICKIHRDLLLGPKNDHRSLRRLHESWAAALRALFSQHTPLFIGYGGNDDSLMDLLESLDPEDIKGQLIWCYHERFEPSDRIVSLVQQHKGALVPVPDFDLLMVLIGDQMGIEPIDDTIEKRAAKRARQYREQLIKLDTTTYPEVRRVLRGAFERAGGTLAWLEKAAAEASTDQRMQIFEQALEHYPNDLSLRLKYAEFLFAHSIDIQRSRDILSRLQADDRDLQYAPSLYLAQMDIGDGRLDDAKKTLAGVPEHPMKHLISGRAEETRGDFASAETLYRLAHANYDDYGFDLAEFLLRQGRMDECETLLKTLHSEARGVRGAATLALFQWKVRKDLNAPAVLIEDVRSSESADVRDLVAVACLDLVKGDVDSCKKVLATLESRPKSDWEDEVCVEFIGLVHQLLAGGQGQPPIQRLRTLLARRYPDPKFLSPFQGIANLAEAVRPRLATTHRKFIVALAEACFDPQRVTPLGAYPQWRPTDGAT